MANYDITEWLKKQHIWLQEMAIRLHIKRELDDKDIVDFIKIIKGELSVLPDYSKLIAKTTTENALRLVSLKDIHGIDKLNPQKPLEFGAGNLSIVYGSNGSGKSGYVRILKKACGKTNSPLNHNVYGATPSKQSCTITYSINATEHEEVWDAKGAGIPKLGAVDIFDGEVGDDYLRLEKEAAYIPYESSLFIDLANLCDRVYSEFSDEKSKLVSKLPQLPEKFKSTKIGGLYANLSHKSPSIIATFGVEDEKALKDLKERLATSNASAKAKKLKERKKQIESIIALVKSVSTVATKEYLRHFCKLCDTASKHRQIATEGTRVLSNVSQLEGVGNDSWKSLWKAAREYSNSFAYKEVAFPNTDDKSLCVLCHQEFNDEAKERLRHFESFIQGKLETDATTAERNLDEEIKNIPIAVVESEIRTRFQAAELSDELGNKIWGFLHAINGLIKQLNRKNFTDAQSFTLADITDSIKELELIASKAEEKALQFEEDAKLFDKEKAQTEVLELEARQWITQQKDAVSAEIDRLNDLQKYEKWMKQANTRAISTEAGIVSEKLVTEAYVDRFNKELKKLGASKITVELVKIRNTKGKGKYRIQLKKATAISKNPSEILSDGEKRIVALAAFLADVTGKAGNIPFIFDDPISSLDQDYEEQTISRLLELGKERQVIIFTHRLSFLSILTDKADDSLTTICINNEPWGTGHPSDTPINAKKPSKALNNLKNERTKQAGKVLAEQGVNAYSIYAQSICSDFRKLIERIVEINLLADVIQRHRRSVNTQGKIHKLALINKDDCDLIDEIMTKYSSYEHSQSNEAPSQLPMPNELEDDISKVAEWLNDFSKRS